MSAPARVYVGDVLDAVCVCCGRKLGDRVPGWFESVNLTPDVLLVGDFNMPHDVELELDIAWDWCSLDCFVRSLFSAAAALGWRARP